MMALAWAIPTAREPTMTPEITINELKTVIGLNLGILPPGKNGFSMKAGVRVARTSVRAKAANLVSVFSSAPIA